MHIVTLSFLKRIVSLLQIHLRLLFIQTSIFQKMFWRDLNIIKCFCSYIQCQLSKKHLNALAFQTESCCNKIMIRTLWSNFYHLNWFYIVRGWFTTNFIAWILKWTTTQLNIAISNLNIAVPSTILISNDILLDDWDIFVNLFLSAISSPCYAELFVISLESSR